MNKRIKNIVTVVLLAAFLFGFGAWAALKPADSLSLSERRRLKQLPAVRMDAVLSGKFMSDFEGYALDQFPLRDEWRTLKALNQLYVYRQKDNNGVYIKDGYAAKLEYPMNESSIDHAAERFRYLYENFMADAGARVYLSVIPDKNYFLAETNGYPAIDYEAFVEALRKQTDFAQYIDLFGQLTLDDYYRTDSHWRQERLPAVAAYLAREMGVTLTDEYTEQVLDRPYYGVYYGYAALPMQPTSCVISRVRRSQAARSTTTRPASPARCTTWKRARGTIPMSCSSPARSPSCRLKIRTPKPTAN